MMKRKYFAWILLAALMLTSILPLVPVSAVGTAPENNGNSDQIDGQTITILSEVSHPAYPASHLFDGNPAWENRWCFSMNGEPASVIFELDHSLMLSQMIMQSHETNSNESPNQYSLSVLVDETKYRSLTTSSERDAYLGNPDNWKTLVTVDNSSDRQCRVTTDIHMDSTASIYRFTVQRGHDGTASGWINVCELYLYEKPALIHPTEVTLLPGKADGEVLSWILEGGSTWSLPDCPFPAPGVYSFAGWRMPDGTVKLPGESVVVTAGLTLTAEWDKFIPGEVTFFSNGGSGDMPHRATSGGLYVLPDCTYTPPVDHHFVGWRLADGTVKQPGESVIVSGHFSLTALWEKGEYVTISFDPGEFGEGSMADRHIPKGTFTLPSCEYFTIQNAHFDKWLVNGERLDPGTVITANASLHITALWAANETVSIYHYPNMGLSIAPPLVTSVSKGQFKFLDPSIYLPRLAYNKQLSDHMLINGQAYPITHEFGNPGVFIESVNEDLVVVNQWDTIRPKDAPPTGELIPYQDIQVLYGDNHAEVLFDGLYKYGELWSTLHPSADFGYMVLQLPTDFRITGYTLYAEPPSMPHSFELEILSNRDEYERTPDAEKNDFFKKTGKARWETISSYTHTGNIESSDRYYSALTPTVSTNRTGDIYRLKIFGGCDISPSYAYIKELALYGHRQAGSMATVHFAPGQASAQNKAYGDINDRHVKFGTMITLPACDVFAPLGYRFAGWKLPNGQIKDPGAQIQVNANMTVTATWELPEQISYLDADGTRKQISSENVQFITQDKTQWWDGFWYLPAGETITIPELIELGNPNTSVDVHLILGDGATLTVNGINCLYDDKFTVYAQSTDPKTMGSLNSRASDGPNDIAGIGSFGPYVSGSITLNGGNISVYSKNSSALGTLPWTDVAANPITINGGIITLKSDNERAICVQKSQINLNGGIIHCENSTDGFPSMIGDLDTVVQISPEVQLNHPEWINPNAILVQKGLFTPVENAFTDGAEIPLLEMHGTPMPNLKFRYRVDASLYSDQMPTVTEPGRHMVSVMATRTDIDVSYQPYIFDIFVRGNHPITPDTTTLTDGTWIADGNITLTERVEITGDVILHLNDGCVLTALCGIHVPQSSTLTIEGGPANSGKLVATQVHSGISPTSLEFKLLLNQAAIGGNADTSNFHDAGVGIINIRGGTVHASLYGTSYYIPYGAAIGSGQYGSGNLIHISGGYVVADASRSMGAAIGSGMCNANDPQKITNAGSIIISGGFVKAISQDGRNGIGGSLNSRPGSFSTGENGHAVIITNAIHDRTYQYRWDGLISTDNGLSYTLHNYSGNLNRIVLPQAPDMEDGLVFDGWNLTGMMTSTAQPGQTVALKDGDLITPQIRHILRVEGHSLTLADRVNLNFVVRLGMDVPFAHAIRFTFPQGQSVTYPIEDAVNLYNGTYLFTVPVAARRMIDTIHADMLDTDGETVLFSDDYSVESYAKVILKNDDGLYDDSTRELVRTMLNYGAAAQLYFRYRTDELVNRSLSEEQKLVPDTTAFDGFVFEQPAPESVEAVGGIHYAGTALNLVNTIGIKHYFKLDPGKTASDYIFRLVRNGKIIRVIDPFMENNLCCVEIDRMFANNLDQCVTLQVFSGESSFDLTYGVYHFGHLVLAKPAGQVESLKHVMKAIDAYHQAAKAYVSEHTH